jgi:CelD/BcsL family acetyltransferase involved in cellulose biosynthesis
MKSITRQIDRFKITISEHYDLIELGEQWKSIQLTGDYPLFLTWGWISCWLTTYKPRIYTLIAYLNEIPVCIGLLTESVQIRHGFIKSRQLRLHQTGDPLKDQIWIEYNDFICLDEYRKSAVKACLQALNEDNSWDEIVISMMPASRASEIADEIPLAKLEQGQPCYAVNFESVKNAKKEFLDTLSRNTRYQVRKSIRLYENIYGPVTIETAQNQQQALDFFNLAGPYHIQRWFDSGYSNPQFVNFHKNLISDSFDKDRVSLLKVKAGQETFAIIYYLLVNKTAYFYLHGLKFETNHNLKPGLVAHALASEYFQKLGFTKYDYMGGYSQYKKQLADLSENLVTVVIQRRRSLFILEDMLRRLKNCIIRPTKSVQ